MVFLSWCYASLQKAVIPETVSGKPVTRISAGAFQNMLNLTEISLPESLTLIQDDAFRNCTNLNEVTIPDSVTEIGKSAFRDCLKLSHILLSDRGAQ